MGTDINLYSTTPAYPVVKPLISDIKLVDPEKINNRTKSISDRTIFFCVTIINAPKKHSRHIIDIVE